MAKNTSRWRLVAPFSPLACLNPFRAAYAQLERRFSRFFVTGRDGSQVYLTQLDSQRIMHWMRASHSLKMASQEAHVYRAALDALPAELERFARFLSAEEKARADRFIRPRDKDHFTAARGTLRELLGRYLDEAPETIQLTANAWGKPALRDARAKDFLHFNLSHSQGMAVYVFAMEGPVGIDIEKIRAEFAGEEIAERYFSLTENEELRALPAELRAEAFFVCWTRKEAYIKARGEGLRIPLNTFDVSLTLGKPATLRSSDCAEWRLISFTPAEQFVGACVAPQAVREFRFLELA